MRCRLVLALLVAATVAAPTVAAAEPLWPGSPTEAVRRHIEETIGIAVDPRMSAAARQEAARLAVARSFDFHELSRRALGEHWSRMTATQREDATAGVRAMLTTVYTSRMGRDLSARMSSMRQRLHFIDESVSGSLASVTMSLSHASQDVSLQVALVRRGREWRIADLAVDGVRLTDNLRAQVTHLSRGTDYGEVLDRLRAHEASAIAAPSASSGRPSR
jgi:ABC-type transporter MlaC component